MLKIFCKTASILIVGFFTISSQADILSDHECSFMLTGGTQSLRSVTLTEEVYGCVHFDNYQDIAIVNADQQLVPLKIGAVPNQVERRKYQQDIEFYEEPDQSSYRTGDQIRRIAALTGVVSRNIDDEQWQSTNVHYSSIILRQPNGENDQRTDELQNISFEVDSDQTPIRATILVEVSDDLQSWRTLSKPHNLYFLQGQTTNLHSNSLTLNSYYYKNNKYLRLAILSNIKDFTTRLQGIIGAYQHTEHQQQPMQWLSASPYKVKGEKHEWQYDLPSLVPVSAIRISNAESIVYYKGVVFAEPHSNPKIPQENVRNEGRSKLKQVLKDAANGRSRRDKNVVKWSTVANLNHYKLRMENGSIESPFIEFSNNSSRTWKIRFDIPANLSAAQMPKVEFGWVPAQLNFVAQGNGPFVLLAGREQTTNRISFPSQLQGFDNSIEEIEILRATHTTNEPKALSQVPAEQLNSFNLVKILLWLILLFGVALMFYMAYRLTRKMNNDET